MSKQFDHRKVEYAWDEFNRFEKYACQLMMTEVVKNHVYITGASKVKEALEGMEGQKLAMHDQIWVQFKIGFVMNDLLAVVGGMRRRQDYVRTRK